LLNKEYPSTKNQKKFMACGMVLASIDQASGKGSTKAEANIARVTAAVKSARDQPGDCSLRTSKAGKT